MALQFLLICAPTYTSLTLPPPITVPPIDKRSLVQGSKILAASQGRPGRCRPRSSNGRVDLSMLDDFVSKMSTPHRPEAEVPLL